MNRPLFAWLLCSCLLACSSDHAARTEIVITVDSDLRVPNEIDGLRIDVTGLVAKQRATADLIKQGLPRNLTLVHDSGGLGPILVTASGLLDGENIVERKVEIWFQVRTSVPLHITLQRKCVMVACDEDKTCVDGACRSIPRIMPGDKMMEAGSPMKSDGGTDAGPDDMIDDDSGPPMDIPESGTPSDDSDPATNAPPVCEITDPKPNESFTTTESIQLRGICSDAESGTLHGLQVRWTNSDGDEVGTGSSLTLDPLKAGMETFALCAPDPVDPSLFDCDHVSITVDKPGPLSAQITDVYQGSDKDSPFAPDEKISLTGVGSGSGIKYAWSDSFVGAFGDEETATLDSPEIGRHRVTFTVTDDMDKTAEDTETFDVLPDGEDSLVQAFDKVNDTLTQGADALAVDSMSQVLASKGASLYRFNATNFHANESAAITGTPSPAITAINQIFIWEEDDLVYLATTTGLVVCDYQAGTAINGTSCTTYSGGGFPSNQVTAVARGRTMDDVDVLVLGTTNGLFVPDDVDGSTTGVPLTGPGTAGKIIAGIAQGVALQSGTSKDAFWFISSSNELGIYLPVDDLISQRNDGIPRAKSSIAKGKDNRVWVGTNKGITRLTEPTGWQAWTVDSDIPGPDLPNNVITSVATTRATLGGDTHDIVWLGSSDGLTRFDPAVPSFMTLTEDDGLPSSDVIAIAVLPTGDKVISTDAGLALYMGR